MAPTSAISSTTALVSALAFPIAYVAPFYLSPTLRSTAQQNRDAPNVIQARVRAVAISCAISTAWTLLLVTQYAKLSVPSTISLLGLYPFDPLDVPKTLLLCSALYVGPLFEQLVIDRAYESWSPASLYAALWNDWTGYRNLLIAPITEELVFRSLIIATYLTSSATPKSIVFGTPLIFGVAHVHHLVDFLRSRTPPEKTLPPRIAIVQGVLITLMQFSYTSLFGFFAAFVYLRTGSLWAPIAAHMFCNWQGLPRFTGRVGQNSAWGHVPQDVAGGTGDGTLEQSEPSVIWDVCYYALLFVGMFAFYQLLWPLTESSHALVQF